MKAIQFKEFGSPDVLKFVEIPEPNLKDDEVLIQVKASGINFGEVVIRSGGAPIQIPLPSIPGSEVSGVIEKLGSQVSGFTVGQRVAAPLFWSGRIDGGYAEFATIKAEHVVPLPDDLSFEEATALQMQGFTALKLLDHVPMKGKTILIHSAAGGVGTFLVQLARIKGAKKIIGVAGVNEKLDYVKSLGADFAVSYKDPDWTKQVVNMTEGFGPEIIYDSVGGESRNKSLEILAPRGTHIIFGIVADKKFEGISGHQIASMYVKNQFITGFSGWTLFSQAGLLQKSFKELFDYVLAKKLRVHIGNQYPLSAAAQAHRDLEASRTKGKVLLIP